MPLARIVTEQGAARLAAQDDSCARPFVPIADELAASVG